MKVQSLLNGGFAEVDDETGKSLITTGHWVIAEAEAVESKPVVRRRSARTKAVPADSGE